MSRIEHFDGETFEPNRDGERLTSQLDAVRGYMLKRFPHWTTLHSIAASLGYGDASIPAISARLRDLRKERFGGYLVERRYVSSGLWEYRVHPKQAPVQKGLFQ